MSDWRTPSVGHYLRWRGVVWTIRLNRNGKLHLDDFETGETEKLKLADYLQGCFDGNIEMLEHPRIDVPEERRCLLEVPLSAMSPLQSAKVEEIRRYIEAYQDPDAFYDQHHPSVPIDERRRPNRMSQAKVDPFLKHVAESFSPPKKVAGFTTFRGWLCMWERYRDWRLMAPLYHKRGSSERRVIVGPLKRIVDRAIKEVWMQRGCPTKKAVCEAVELDVLRHNLKHPESPVGVSWRQIYSYMDKEVDAYEAAVARKGKAWADKRFKPKFQGPGADRIMQVVEVDHTRSKLDVTDDETGQTLGRPWITAALCRRSRMVVGLHIHFEDQTLNAVMQCLRNVMMPKRFLKRLVPELDYEYPCCGTPESFFFDRGKDFDSDHVREVGLNLDVVIKYAPGDNPELKGSIERFFGTLHEQTALGVKGAMPRIKDREPGRPRRSQATMPFSDFCARVWDWLTMVYAKEFHQGLGDTPLNVWNESAAVRQPRPPPTKGKLDAFLMRAVRCEPTVHGVRHAGLAWNGEVIRRIRSHPGHRRGEQILVRIDDNDLGRAFATDPVTGRLEPLDPVLDRYMPGLTMHQHELVQRKVKQKQEGTHSERSLLEAKERIRKQAIESFKSASTGSKTRARLARLLNVGGEAPAGDELGSLDPRVRPMIALSERVTVKPGVKYDVPIPSAHTIQSVAADKESSAGSRPRRSGPARRLD